MYSKRKKGWSNAYNLRDSMLELYFTYVSELLKFFLLSFMCESFQDRSCVQSFEADFLHF